MRLRLAKMALVVLLLALGAVPSGAGPFHVRHWQSSGGLAVTPLSDGSRAIAGIWATRRGYQEGNFLLPGPSGTPGVNLVPDPQNPTYVGCIFIFVGQSLVDHGCEITPPSSVTMDPAMRTATLVFTVHNSQGYTLSATLILEGAGDIGPMEGTLEPVVSSDPAQGFPRIVFGRSLIGLARTASVQGAVRSYMTGIGGGTRTGATQQAAMTQGLFNAVRQGNLIEFRPGVDVYVDTNKPVCVNTSDPPNCPIP